MAASPRQVLVLYWHPESEQAMRAAIHHHLRTLDYSDETCYQVVYCNTFGGVPAWVRCQKFDGIVLHNTLLCLRWSHLFDICKWNLRWIRDSRSVKIALSQDEYDHSEILDEWLFEWGVSTVFTNFDATHRKTLYPIMHDKADFFECFTGYVDEKLGWQYEHKPSAVKARPYDIVYRASHLPYWFGSQGQLKHQIGDIVANRAKMQGLRADISTRVEDTILGGRWLDFLASGRAVIGCESGSSVLDRRGEIRAQIQTMLRRDPTLSFEEVSNRLPRGWDNYRFFAISPRHFEAVITKTCQILVRGHYGGVLEANKHYIPLERDLSNVDEVLEKLKDDHYVQTIVDQAYQDIYLNGNYTYRKFATDILTALSKKTINETALNEEKAGRFSGYLTREHAYSHLRGFSAMARYYLYPGKAILNRPLKPFLKKCFQYWRNCG